MKRCRLFFLFLSGVVGCGNLDCDLFYYNNCRSFRQEMMTLIPTPIPVAIVRRRAKRIKPLTVRRTTTQQTIPNLGGDWNISLNWERGSCPNTPFRLDSSVSIRQVGQRVIVSVPNVGALFGRVNRRGFSLRGSFVPQGALCLTTSRVTGNTPFNTDIVARDVALSATVSLECLSGLTCSVRYGGRLQR